MAKKRNYDKLQSQSNADTARFRNVYEEQQMDRSRIGEKVTMASRAPLAIAAALAVGILFWWLAAKIETTGKADSVNASWDAFWLKNQEARSNYQYVTTKETKYLFEDDGIMPIIDPETGKHAQEAIYHSYILNRETRILIDVQSGKFPEYTGCPEMIPDPETGEYCRPEQDEENNILNSLPKDENGNPMTPRIYLRLVPEARDSEYYLGYIDPNTYGDVYNIMAVEAYVDYNNKYGDGDETRIGLDILSDEIALSRYGFELKGNGNTAYKLYYGEVFESTGLFAIKKPFSMRPTPLKLLLSLITSGITFGLLWMILKKNLDALNVEYDTSDINQHYDDQHIALPEEVQKAYDIFPDVGAHSRVMVSSMISHQMLTNKGLKTVKLARRAKENILDEDGDIITFKGDILKDENGEPICDEVPLIDTEFSDALYDSSKTPENIKGEPPTRVYFDATKISYNPGNGNLDKLKGYDTVAELINKDWEFPVYEPQRPGGVYIVDTAPVNTMVLAITRAGKGNVARSVA